MLAVWKLFYQKPDGPSKAHLAHYFAPYLVAVIGGLMMPTEDVRTCIDGAQMLLRFSTVILLLHFAISIIFELPSIERLLITCLSSDEIRICRVKGGLAVEVTHAGRRGVLRPRKLVLAFVMCAAVLAGEALLGILLERACSGDLWGAPGAKIFVPLYAITLVAALQICVSGLMLCGSLRRVDTKFFEK